MAETLVVISHYDARPKGPLRKLLRSMKEHAAGVEFAVCLAVNSDSGADFSPPEADFPVEILRRPNTGMNIGAWDAAWRAYPGYRHYLFLQDECEITRSGWLAAYQQASEASGGAMIGESLNEGWDKPWAELRRLQQDVRLPGHLLDGHEANRVDLYLEFFRRRGIEPGPTARHLRALVWYLPGNILEAIGGFPVGSSFGECIAAEIAVSRLVERRGFRVLQAHPSAFRFIRHDEWVQDPSGAVHKRPERAATLLVPLAEEPSAGLERTLRSWFRQEAADVGACLLPMGESAARSAGLWLSRRGEGFRNRVSIHAGPLPRWDGLAACRYVLFALPGDEFHPALASSLAEGSAEEPPDVVVFNEEGGRKNPRLLRRPDLQRYTLWHVPYIGRAFAVRPRLVEEYPYELLPQLRENGAHLFHAWLSLRPGLRWRTIPRPLRIARDAEDGFPAVPEVGRLLPLYREVFGSLRDSFELAADGSESAYRLEPRRRARKISVVIPFRDHPDETQACLESVLAQRLSADLEILLVDNQSGPECLERLRDFLERRQAAPRVRWIRYDAAFNHSRQCNLALEAAQGEVLVLLNNDAVLLDDGMLEQMAAWALVPDVGSVGCRIVDGGGRLVSAGIRARDAAAADPPASPVEESRDETFASCVRETYGNTFACAALSRERMLSVGPLNEAEFPNGYNDVEYALRLRKAGFRHVYLGHLRARHVAGQSRGRSDESREKRLLRERYPHTSADARLQLETVPSARGPFRGLAAAAKGAARRILGLPYEDWAAGLGSRHGYRWTYRRARGRHIVDTLAGEAPAPAYDLVFVVPEQSRGWILEAVCRELQSRFPGRTAFHYAAADPPPARAYFLCHYGVLPKFLKLNPFVWGSRILVFYTHPSPLPIDDRELAYALNHADGVICMNSASARGLRDRGVSGDKACWIAGGADPALFRPHDRGGGAVGFCTAYYERKRPDRILEIVAGMPHRRFLLLGKGWRAWPRFGELEALPNFTYVEAPYSEYPAYYGKMDVFVSPAVLEGGPIPLIEAMMSNAVPVASATGFAPDIIRHGENGFLFDPEAPAARILPLIEQAYRLEADVSRQARDLSWDGFASKVLARMFPAG